LVSIEAFIDLAWAGSSGAARGDKMLQHTNVENAVKNVKLAAALGASLYLGVGTITEVTALAEDASAGPATTYGLSKHLAHQETKKAAKELGIDHIWARLGNTYSEEDTSGRFLDATLRKLAADEDVELLTGNQPFDFIHLTDAVRAIHLLSFAGVSGETYYVGNGDVATIEDFVLVAGNILNSKSHIKSHFVDKLGLTAEDLSNEAIVELGYNQDVSFIQGVKLWKEYNRS
jgi:UDP-glucose 4-epimerase